MKRRDSAAATRVLMQLQADVHRAWQVGDACLSFTNGAPATTFVERVGDIVTLADKSSGHFTRMRRA